MCCRADLLDYASGMQIREIRIDGIRGFGGDQLSIPLASTGKNPPRWIVLAGRNGAGKSTFLQAAALAIAGPSVARLLAESFAGWVRQDRESASVAVRLQFEERDIFSAGRKPTFDPWVGLTWKAGGGPEPSLDKYNPGRNWDPFRGPWAENPKGWFTAGYGPFRRISPAPTEAQRVMMTPGRPAGLASLFREEASLSESVQWLQQIYLRRLEQRPNAQNDEELILGMLGDGLLPEGMSVDRVDSEGLWIRSPEGQSIALNSLSDGYRTVAAMVLDLLKQLRSSVDEIDYSVEEGGYKIHNEGVVFIDEVDVHLHVEWQKRIGFWLKSHFPNVQFIVSTHSPFICQAADEGGLIGLAPSWSGEVQARVIEGEEFRRVVNGTLDDAILSNLFGVESVISERSEAIRGRIAELESRLLRGGLEGHEAEELDELRGEVPTSQADLAIRKALSAIGEGV